MKRGAIIGLLIGGCLGCAFDALALFGWVLCVSTGSNCGSSTSQTLAAIAAVAAGGAVGAAVGAYVTYVPRDER